MSEAKGAERKGVEVCVRVKLNVECEAERGVCKCVCVCVCVSVRDMRRVELRAERESLSS